MYEPHSNKNQKEKERNPNISPKKLINHKEREQKKKGQNYKNNQKTYSQMEITTYLSIITLNENDINVPIIRHGVLEWI